MSQPQRFQYCCITNSKHVLCYYQAEFSADFETHILRIINNQRIDKKCSFPLQDGSKLCVVSENGLNFMCVIKTASLLESAYQLLGNVKTQFTSNATLMSRASQAGPGALQADFSNVLQQEMRKAEKANPMAVLYSEVEEVRELMTQNIEKLMDREVKLNDLSDKAENLAANAEHFSTTARKVKRKMWWQNLKMKIILGVVVSVILIIIIVVILYSTGALTAKGGGGDSGGGGDQTTTPSLPHSSAIRKIMSNR